ncbi:MAG TPA: antitoxin Xre/MbcA/ParS toxin-binding domain-containing protein [Chryseolinea sp.]|nr:antitoxin Xre/MbcA/ParS toxin-binding domain-containing protein [Chryseolinea sp.]
MIKFLEHLGEAGLGEVDSRQGLWHAIRQRPLKKRHVIFISYKLGLPQKDTAELIGVSVRTYQRQSKTTSMSFAASENILKLAELYEIGLSAFDNNSDSFVTWLDSPIPALNNDKPIQLLSSSLGIDLVKEELLRIEYGVH